SGWALGGMPTPRSRRCHRHRVAHADREQQAVEPGQGQDVRKTGHGDAGDERTAYHVHRELNWWACACSRVIASTGTVNKVILLPSKETDRPPQNHLKS